MYRHSLIFFFAFFFQLQLEITHNVNVVDPNDQYFYTNDSQVVLGQHLFECGFQRISDSSVACNQIGALSRPDLPTPPEIRKTGDGNIFKIVLTAQVRSVDLFDLHYRVENPNLILSQTLQLPEEQNVNATEVWTFNGSLPGPTIRASVGDILEIKLHNTLPVATGLFIPGVFNAREPLEGGFVRPGKVRLFRIPLSRAGVFQYHSSVDAQYQIPMGLFGVLVVESPTSPKTDDHVIIISDALVNENTWKIYPPLHTPAKRAEEQYNGRLGNIILVNGRSISAGPQLTLTSGVQHRLHFSNAASSRMLKISIPPVQFKIESQWMSTDLFTDEQTVEFKKSFVLPPRATATLIVDITDETSDVEYEVIAADITSVSERRRATLKSPNSPEADLVGPIVSETWTTIGSAMNVRVVDLLLIPSNDGIVSPSGFEDILNLPQVVVWNQTTDKVLKIDSCSDEINCPQPVWGFKIADFVPQDAELVEASLLFELICPAFSQIPRVDINLFPITPEQLTTIALQVPNGTAIYTDKRDNDLPVAHTTITCIEGRIETPVDLRSSQLNKFLQKMLSGNGADGINSLVWLRAQFQFDYPHNAEKKHLLVATREGNYLPPPTLRLVYKSMDSKAGQLVHSHSTHPQNVKARHKRLQQVFREMQNEQQDMQIQLQTLYDRVNKKQHRQRIAQYNRETAEGVLDEVTEGLRQKQHEELVEELQNHLRQQEEQRQVEQKIFNLQRSELPLVYKEQLMRELEHQLQMHYLKQKFHQFQLRKKLNGLSSSNNNYRNRVERQLGGGRAFRGVARNKGANYGELSYAEARVLKNEKILYMRLYKQYNDLVEQMKHIKSTSDFLKAQLLLQQKTSSESRSKPSYEYYNFVPVEDNDPYKHLPTQKILRLHVVQGLSASAAEFPQPRPRHRLASDLSRVTDEEEGWNNTATSSAVPVVVVSLGQSKEADYSGRLSMWIDLSVTHQKQRFTELSPGTLVVWKIINPTPLTHTLYFHRVLLEIFQRETVYSNKSSVITEIGQENPQNGHIVGITIPAASQLDESFSIIRAVSTVPKLTAGLKRKNLYRWDIRVHSTILEHMSNGMTARLQFNVKPLHDKNNKIEPPSGIDFSAMDMYEDDDQDPTSHRIIVAATFGGCLIVVAVVASFRYYRDTDKTLFNKKRCCSDVIDSLETCHKSSALEMTPTSRLDGGSPILTNSFEHSSGASVTCTTGSTTETASGGHRLLSYPTPRDSCDVPSTLSVGVQQTYLRSAERHQKIKHRPTVSTPEGSLYPSPIRTDGTSL